MEDNQYPDDELMDEDEDEDDVDMEYGEETGSEDTSATEDDEDEIQAGVEGPGDAWEESEDEEDAEMQDEEDDEGEDDEEGDEDEEDIIDEEGPDEDDEGDEDEEGEMIWEVRVRPSKATKPELMKPSGHRSRGLARSSYTGR